jgi:hypothetical protein
MTILLARLKQAARWLWAGLVVFGGVLAVALGYLLLRRRGLDVGDAIDVRLMRHQREVDLANARAAVEIEAARAPSRQERAQLIEILKDTDEDRQAERLIAAARRIRGE